MGSITDFADQTFKIGKESGAVAKFKLRYFECYGISGFSGRNHPKIIQEIKKLPLSVRKDAPWFGWCAEIDCFNKAFRDGKFSSLKGGQVWAVNIGYKYGHMHGVPKSACPACCFISKNLGVKCR